MHCSKAACAQAPPANASMSTTMMTSLFISITSKKWGDIAPLLNYYLLFRLLVNALLLQVIRSTRQRRLDFLPGALRDLAPAHVIDLEHVPGLDLRLALWHLVP